MWAWLFFCTINQKHLGKSHKNMSRSSSSQILQEKKMILILGWNMTRTCLMRFTCKFSHKPPNTFMNFINSCAHIILLFLSMHAYAWLFTPAQTHTQMPAINTAFYMRCAAAFTHIASLWFVCVVRGHTSMLSYSNFHSSPSTHTHTLISLFLRDAGIFRPLRWREMRWPSY